MHHKPVVSLPVLRTVLVILVIEATIAFALWQSLNLWRAICYAATRYEGPETLAAQQLDTP